MQALRVHQDKALNAMNAATVTAAAPPPDPFDLVVWDSTIEQYVRPIIGEVVTSFATHTLTFLRMPDDIAARVLGALDVTSHITDFVDKVRTIGNNLAQRVMEEMGVGIGQGESIAKLSARITNSFDVAKSDATRIARTETHGIAERTSFEAAKGIHDSGIELEKEWLQTFDARTRPTHRAEGAGGQVRPLLVPFNVGEALLDHPGAAGPLSLVEEVANCRCSVVYSERSA